MMVWKSVGMHFVVQTMSVVFPRRPVQQMPSVLTAESLLAKDISLQLTAAACLSSAR